MSDKGTTLSHLPAYHHFCHILCCHVTDVVVDLVTHCHCFVAICVWFVRQRNQNCRTLSVCCRFVAPFYHRVTNIVTQFVTSVVLSYHLVAIMWLSYVRQSNYIVTLTSLSPFLSHPLLSCNWRGHPTCHTLSLFSCHLCLVVRQRNQNCCTLSVCCRFVASFYRHVTNIVTQLATSVILSYHLVAVMWLSYVRQSNCFVTLTSLSQFLSACLLSCNCRDRRTWHTCHYLVVICVCFV